MYQNNILIAPYPTNVLRLPSGLPFLAEYFHRHKESISLPDPDRMRKMSLS